MQRIFQKQLIWLMGWLLQLSRQNQTPSTCDVRGRDFCITLDENYDAKNLTCKAFQDHWIARWSFVEILLKRNTF